MPVPTCGNGRACGGASSEAEANPRARRNLLEGGVNPRARRNLLEGAFEWAALVGRGDLRSVGRAPCVCLSGMCLVWFFAGFKQDSPGCFRGPSGLSPIVAPEHLRVRQPGSRRCWNLLIGHPSPLVAKAFRGAVSADPRV
jgi:hypothetical protein